VQTASGTCRRARSRPSPGGTRRGTKGRGRRRPDASRWWGGAARRTPRQRAAAPMLDASSMQGRRGSGAVRVAPGGCGRRARARRRGGAADGPAIRGSGRRVPSAADPTLLPSVCQGVGAHRAARPLAVPGEMPEAWTAKAPHRPGARCDLVLIGEAVEAPPDGGDGDARRSRLCAKVLPCATLPAPAAGALAADLGEAVGIDARGAGLPRGHDDDRSNRAGAAGRARSRTSFDAVGQSVNQLLLAAAPLLVAARVRFDARAETVMDRTGSLRGRHRAGGRCRHRLRLHLRRGVEQDVTVGGAGGGVARGRELIVRVVLRRGGVVPPA
jgi:hypothetical protein